MPSSDPDSWVERVSEGMREYERERASSPHDLPPIPRYDIRERLGQGATSSVYRAWDRELQRPVAIKMLRLEATAEEILRRRFEREGRAMAGLSHPNVVGVYDVGEEEGRPYLVLELVEGSSLGEILRGHGHDLRSRLLLLEKTSAGVAAAHGRGVVHRDLKPGNILVTADGIPKVGDFGLALWIEATTRVTATGSPVGTPTYMAPEQAEGLGDDVSPRTDVYALGAILYEILTGRPPHIGSTVAEVYHKILHETPLPVRRLNPGAPRDLETIAARAMERDPLRRYASAKEFEEDLRRHRENEPILARPPNPALKLLRWMRRHPTPTAVASVLILAVTGLGVLLRSSEAARREKHRREIEAHLADGRRAYDKFSRLEAELDRLREEEKALAGSVVPHDGEERKIPLWDLRRRIESKAEEVAFTHGAVLAAFTSALGVDPGNREARAALARTYFQDYEGAEQRDDRLAMNTSERMTRLFDDGRYASRLEQTGTVALDSNPSQAEAHLFRYEEGADRRLRPVPYNAVKKEGRSPAESPEGSEFNRLGVCPVPSTRVPSGSYLLVLRKKGFRDVRYPLRILRGMSHEAKVNLYTEEEIGEGFAYVPAGKFVKGGDPMASPATEANPDPFVPDYFISEHETTIDAYNAFLNDRDFHTVEDAWLRIPRNPGLGEQIGQRSGTTIRMNPVWSGFPVMGISWEDAHRFCEWLTQRRREAGDPSTYRMPTSLEWEKAARGVDGRLFPWGFHFDPTFAKGADSRPGAGGMEPIRSFPKDESPYGILDMAGSMREWCEDGGDSEKKEWKIVRGGGWSDNEVLWFRAASLQYQNPEGLDSSLGFRIVRVPDRR